MTQRKLTLLRGLPGSGKSRYVRENYDLSKVVVCSADDYFLDTTGEYNFVPTLIGEAHVACFTKALRACAQGEQDVIIDNTNTHMFEAAPYLMLANTFDMNIDIVRIMCPASVAAERNIHGVPASAIVGMEEGWETFPPFWPAERCVNMNS